MKTAQALAFKILLALVALTTPTLLAQPVINTVKPTNGNSQLRFDITGGNGPFAIERASLANDPWCSLAATISRSNVLTGIDGNHAFFRVRDLSNAPATRFTVSLSGASEVPAVTTTGDGFGTLEINGDTLSFDIAFRNLVSPSTASHIHLPAVTASNASVSINFQTFIVGGSFGTTNGRIAGSVALTASQKASLMSGLAYVNVHTSANPGGEIRGQVTPTTFRVVMSGASERANPNNSPAYGIGSFTLIGRELSYHIAYQGLSGTATASHIHGAAGLGGTAGVMYDLIPVGGFGRSGTLAGRTNLTPAQIAAIVDGKAYANIHTSLNPGGEIRGQVLPILGEAPFSAELTGAAQRPTPVVTSASAFTFTSLQSNVLSFAMMYRNLSGPATAAHIHGASPASGSAGVLYDLAPFHRGSYSTQGVFIGSIALTSTDVSNLLNGDLYMNIHTAANGGGEVRGQLCPMIFPVTASGANERPTPIAPAGTAFGYVGMVGKQFTVGVHYRDMTTLVNNAHIHGPADTNTAAGVLIGLTTANYTAGGFSTNGFLLGSQAITDAQMANIVDFLTYLNIHTTANGGGEIRGQVMP